MWAKFVHGQWRYWLCTLAHCVRAHMLKSSFFLKSLGLQEPAFKTWTKFVHGQWRYWLCTAWCSTWLYWCSTRWYRWWCKPIIMSHPTFVELSWGCVVADFLDSPSSFILLPLLHELLLPGPPPLLRAVPLQVVQVREGVPCQALVSFQNPG